MLYYISESGYTQISNGTVIAVAVAIFAIIAAFYVLRGLGLYKLAKKYGVKYPILAWFPFTWFYVAGMLLGDVALFGRKIEKFALIAFIVFTVSGVFYSGVRLVSYIPVVGFFLQGGTTYISYSTTNFTGCNAIFDTSFGYVGLVRFIDPYSDTLWKVLNILSYVARLFSIVSLIFTVLVYSNFFRSFLPNHYFIATLSSILLSSFGLFGVWAFVVRNNERIKYADYMRARYAAFYGVNRGYGDGGNGAYQPPRQENGDGDDPFSDVEGEKKKSGSDGSDDPFGEFDDKK